MKIRFVKQEHKFGCAVACIAMVLNKNYSEIDKNFLNNFDVKGITFDSILHYLGENGFSVVYKTTRNYYEKDFAKKEMLRPFAPVHIIGVKPCFDSKSHHVVVMDNKGKIFCPQGIDEKEIKNSYEIVEVAGLYK
jgi:hypothetical protein